MQSTQRKQQLLNLKNNVELFSRLYIDKMARLFSRSWLMVERRYVFVRLREEKERSQAALLTAIVNAMSSNHNNSGNTIFSGLSLSITS